MHRIFNFQKERIINYNVCPNELYVATTRTLEHLILFHHETNDYLPFSNLDKIKEYANLDKYKNIHLKK